MAGKSILIGGGTGFIGQELVSIFMRNNWKVSMISRMPAPKSHSWLDIERFGLPQCDAVLNVAGQNVLNPMKRWNVSFQQDVWSSRVQTTKVLATAINESKTPPKVFAHISGVGFYKPSQTEKYTETSPGGDFDYLSRLCSEWEAASSSVQNSKVRRAVVRSGVVLGTDGGMVAQIKLPFLFGLGGPVGSGQQFMPWISLTDIGRLFYHIVTTDGLSGIFNGVSPNILTNGEFSKAFAAAMWRPCLIPLPVAAVNLAFGRERAKIMTEGQMVVPERTLETGFEFKYPDINQAIKAALYPDLDTFS